MKLITRGGKSIPSNKLVIVEQLRYKAKNKKQPGKPLEVELAGGYNYVVYYLETPGVLDDAAVFEAYFETEEEAIKEYSGVELIRWKDISKHDRYTL